MVLEQTLVSPYLPICVFSSLSYSCSLSSGDNLLVSFAICGSNTSWIYAYINLTLSSAKVSCAYLWIDSKQISLLSCRNSRRPCLVEEWMQNLYLTLYCLYQLHTTHRFAVIPICFVIFTASSQHLVQFFHCSIWPSTMHSFISCWFSIILS